MTHTLAKGEQLWSDDALAHLAVDLSVGGKPQNVYAKLKIVRDDMQARIDELERVPYRTGAAPAVTGVPSDIVAIAWRLLAVGTSVHISRPTDSMTWTEELQRFEAWLVQQQGGDSGTQ